MEIPKKSRPDPVYEQNISGAMGVQQKFSRYDRKQTGNFYGSGKGGANVFPGYF